MKLMYRVRSHIDMYVASARIWGGRSGIGLAMSSAAVIYLLLKARWKLSRKHANNELPVTAVANAESANATPGDDLNCIEARSQAKMHLKFGNFCARNGNPKKALDHYHEAIRLHPAYAVARHNAGGVCQRLKMFEEAVTHYEAALAIDPSLLEAASNLAVALLNCKRAEAALEWCRKAIQMQSDAGEGLNREAFHHLNVSLRLLGRRCCLLPSTKPDTCASACSIFSWLRLRPTPYFCHFPFIACTLSAQDV